MSSHKSNHQARTWSSFVTSAANGRHWLTASLAICLLALSFPMGLHAQEYRGLILGQVKDPSGAVIHDAKVTAKGPQQTYSTTSNAEGSFSIPFVQPGTYQVTVEAPGFKKSVEKNVVVSVAQKVNLNFRLEVGTVSESVEVVASAVAVNTADASGGSVVGTQETQNLPLNGRQVYMLAQLNPGVLFTGSNGAQRGWDQTNSFQINGVVNNQNQFTMNGAPISQQTSTARGAWFISPNVDAVQEFKIQTTNYDASVGRSGGGTINLVIKQGTNALHGAAFDYWRNAVLDANFYQLNQLNQRKGFHNQHDFGGTFGGPIKKDKTYFFASFEGWREVQPAPVITTVPTGIVVNPDGSVDMSAYLKGPGVNHNGGIYNPFSCASTNADGTCKTRNRLSVGGKNDVIPANLVSQIGLKILALYPKPNQPGFINNFVSNTGGRTQYNQTLFRIDHNISDRTKIYGMFSWWSGTDFRNNSGFSDPRIETGNINHTRAFLSQILSATHTFNSTLVADVRVSYTREVDSSPDGGLAAGTAKLSPQDLGFTTYPVPPSTSTSFAPVLNNNDVIANIIGTRAFSDFGHPPFNADFEVAPTISQTIGNHNLRYGGQYLKVIAIPCCAAGEVAPTSNGPGGIFNFTDNFTRFNPNNANTDPAGVTGSTGSGLASIIMGIPNDGNIPYNLAIYETYPYYAAFVQDDWKIHPRLTLNLGMRWDFEHSPHERHDRLNGGLCYTCVNPLTGILNSANAFPPNNTLLLKNGTSTGFTMPNPIVGGFTFLGNGRRAYDTQYNHFQPRIGVSWALNDKTVVRGGYGVNYGFAFELGGNTTFTQVTNYFNPNPVTPGPGFFNGNPYPAGLTPPTGPLDGLLAGTGSNSTSYDQRNRKITRVQHYSLGIQHEFPGGFVLDTSFVGTYTGNIRVGTNFNALTPAQIAQCATLAAAAAAVRCDSQVQNPFFGHMGPNQAASVLNLSATVPAYILMEPFPQFDGTLSSNTEPIGRSDYNSLQVQFRKRVDAGPAWLKGITLVTAFTWQKNMTYTSLNNNSNGQCQGCVDIAGPGHDILTPFIAKPYYQLDGSDRTLNLAFSGIWDLPVGRNRPFFGNASGWVGQVINNWSLDWIFTDASGTPIQPPNTFTYNCPQNNNSYIPAHRSFSEWIYNETPSCYTPLATNTWIPRTVVTRQNNLRAPYKPLATFALQKQFDIRESMKLQFRAEAFNAFNTPIFGGPSTGNPNLPVTINPNNIPGIQPGTPGYCSGYGCIGANQQNAPRQLQLSLKIIF